MNDFVASYVIGWCVCALCLWAAGTVSTSGQSRSDSLFLLLNIVVEHFFFWYFQQEISLVVRCVTFMDVTRIPKTDTKCTLTGSTLNCLLASHIRHPSKCSVTYTNSELWMRYSHLQNVWHKVIAYFPVTMPLLYTAFYGASRYGAMRAVDTLFESRPSNVCS